MPTPLNSSGIISMPATLFNISQIFSNIQDKSDKVDLKSELLRLKCDLRAWDKIPFYKAYNLALPPVASKSPEEIKVMRARTKEIEKELSS